MIRKACFFGMGLFLFLVVAVPRDGFSQVLGNTSVDDGIDMNVVKINVLALPFRNVSLQYERLITRKISIGVGLRMIPEGQFPMLDAFEPYFDKESFDLMKDISISNTAITIEPRFYFGKHDGMRGFYIAPYARYSSYALAFDKFEYEVDPGDEEFTGETQEITLDGKINGFTGGILFGSQWRIARWVYVDWWILGPAYGSAKGKLNGVTALSPEDQEGLREELQNLEIPMVETKAHVDENGARVDLKGPWAGVRAGLAIGIRF